MVGNIGYAIVKRISAETNVRVYIAPKEDQPPAFCSLEGTFDNVNRYRLLLALLSNLSYKPVVDHVFFAISFLYISEHLICFEKHT